ANGGTIKTTSYYPAGGAMRVSVGVNSTGYYLLKDHLGSASLFLDSGGNAVLNGEQHFYPLREGPPSQADLQKDQLFTGQQQPATLGLYSYGARMYDAKIGRFISADTIVSEPGNPQALNRYSYVVNSPLNYVDPTGHVYDTWADCNNFAPGRNDAYTN